MPPSDVVTLIQNSNKKIHLLILKAMKNLLHLRNNQMNTSLRSILASSMIALTMMSCSKEDIQPTASYSSLENARTRSTASQLDNGAIAANTDQALVAIQIAATAHDASARIIITTDGLVHISGKGQKANQFSEYRIDPSSFTNLLDFLQSSANTDEAYSASNQNAFLNSQPEAYHATNKNAFLHTVHAEGYTATNENAFLNNQSEAYTATNSLASTITEVQYRSCTTCNPIVFTNDDAQARTRSNNFIADVDRIINLHALINSHRAANR